MENINHAKPTVFTTVPLMLERIFTGLTAGADKDENAKKALDIALNYEFGDETRPEFIQAKQQYFDGWKAKFGGNLSRISVAGAPLPAWLDRFYWAIGLPLFEIYGLSECFSVTYTRGRDYAKFGSVGAIAEASEVRIADDGEILYRGPYLMKGFHNLPEYTKQVINEDGFFHTGDLGELVDGKFIRITGRKKDVFKVVSGYYVSPPLIEEKINASAYIARCIVFPRNGRVALIIQPEYNLLAEELGMTAAELAKPEHNGLVLDKIRTEVDKHYNTHVMDAERVAEYFIDPIVWSVEGGELTPTMKIKREVIIKKLEII
jgi:long-chain acyl-CoA synthetase